MTGSSQIHEQMMASAAQRARVAYCECGARLAGGSVRELLDVAEWHFVRCHPQWLPEDVERPLIRRAALGDNGAAGWQPGAMTEAGDASAPPYRPAAGR
jgi:hypothetical protein